MTGDSISRKPVSNQGQNLSQQPTLIAAGQIAAFDGSEAVTHVGVEATDIVIVTAEVQDTGGDYVNLVGAASADTVTITGTATSSTGTVNYVVVRP